MSAYVEHKFSHGFLIDEERLRKIHELISVRIRRLEEPPSLRYKVYRGDSFSYETDNVSDVASEDNDDWRAITKLELLATDPDTFNFRLTFSDDGVAAEIVGDDRDQVFLLFSDLKAYIEEQVLVGRLLSNDAARGIGLTLILLLFVGMMITASSQLSEPTPEALSQALQAEDALDKLDFLIEERSRSSPDLVFFWWLLGIMLAMLVTTTGGISALWRFAFPSNLFLFGQRKQKYEHRRAIVGRIFWVIIVGLPVSAAAGFLVWWLTSV